MRGGVQGKVLRAWFCWVLGEGRTGCPLKVKGQAHRWEFCWTPQNRRRDGPQHSSPRRCLESPSRLSSHSAEAQEVWLPWLLDVGIVIHTGLVLANTQDL